MTRKLVRLILLLSIVFSTTFAFADDPGNHLPFEDDSYIEILIVGDPVLESTSTASLFDGCGIEGCLLVDDAIEAHSWKGESIDLVRVGGSLLDSTVADVLEPQIFKLAKSGYQFLTWDGVMTSSEINPVEMVAQTAASLPPAVPALAFDIEREIGIAWMELQFGIAPAEAPVPYQSTMDRYWQYYSDCDRWGVVFVDATIVPVKKPSGEFWQVVVEKVQDTANGILTKLKQVAVEVQKHAEFIKIESNVPTAFKRPFIDVRAAEEWSNKKFVSYSNLVADQVEGIVEQYQETAIPAFVERLVVDHQVVEMEWRNQQAKAYLAPRLNWLSQVLGAAAKKMETSELPSAIEVANDAHNLMK